MKKILTIIAIISALLLNACGNDKYVLDNSDLPENRLNQYEEEITTNLELYKNTENETEKLQYTENLAFSYMSLKNYKKSIYYYEEILENDPVHFPALNNIAVMHERVGEVLEALKYQQRLYEANPSNIEVVSDTIRLLLENGRKEDALGVLEIFAVTEIGKNNMGFVSDQFELIRNS